MSPCLYVNVCGNAFKCLPAKYWLEASWLCLLSGQSRQGWTQSRQYRLQPVCLQALEHACRPRCGENVLVVGNQGLLTGQTLLIKIAAFDCCGAGIQCWCCTNLYLRFTKALVFDLLAFVLWEPQENGCWHGNRKAPRKCSTADWLERICI